MTTLQEAACKALYALEEATTYTSSPSWSPSMTWDCESAIKDLRTALAQQGEQAKPVAYITDTEQGPMVWTPEMYDEACTYCDDGEFPIPLYTAAPAPQEQDKSDNYLSGYCTGRTDLLKELCEFRNQPVTQPLTGKEIAACIPDNTDMSWVKNPEKFTKEFVRAIEAAHGIGEVK